MKWKRDWNPSVSDRQCRDTQSMAFFLFCSLQAACIIMKIGIMILRFLPEENENTVDVRFFLMTVK